MQVERLKLLRKCIKWRKGEEYISMYPKVEDSPEKFGVILDVVSGSKASVALGAENVLSGSW